MKYGALLSRNHLTLREGRREYRGLPVERQRRTPELLLRTDGQRWSCTLQKNRTDIGQIIISLRHINLHLALHLNVFISYPIPVCLLTVGSQWLCCEWEFADDGLESDGWDVPQLLLVPNHVVAKSINDCLHLILFDFGNQRAQTVKRNKNTRFWIRIFKRSKTLKIVQLFKFSGCFLVVNLHSIEH